MPQASNVTDFRTGLTAHRLVPVDHFSLFLFSIYLTLGLNDTDCRHGFQHIPTLHSTGRLLLTPPSTRFSRMLAYAYFPLLPPVPPALLRGGHRFVVQ